MGMECSMGERAPIVLACEVAWVQRVRSFAVVIEMDASAHLMGDN